jgi:hypothetical protein
MRHAEHATDTTTALIVLRRVCKARSDLIRARTCEEKAEVSICPEPK